MTLDAETIRWLFGGFVGLCLAIITYLLNREITRVDASLTEQKERVAVAQQQLNDFRLDVAREYVSKSDLEKQLDTHLSPIRDDMRDIKGDIKALLQRP